MIGPLLKQPTATFFYSKKSGKVHASPEVLLMSAKRSPSCVSKPSYSFQRWIHEVFTTVMLKRFPVFCAPPTNTSPKRVGIIFCCWERTQASTAIDPITLSFFTASLPNPDSAVSHRTIPTTSMVGAFFTRSLSKTSPKTIHWPSTSRSD